MATPELEPKPQVPENVEVVTGPDSVPEISPAVERAGVTPAQPTPQPVQDDNGQVVVQPVSDQPVVTIPKQQDDLKQQSKGSSDDASTWFALFWLRMIKKALHFGRKVVLGKGKQS